MIPQKETTKAIKNCRNNLNNGDDLKTSSWIPTKKKRNAPTNIGDRLIAESSEKIFESNKI